MHVPAGPLSSTEIDHFRRFGYVHLRDCFDTGPGSLAAEWVARSWQRVDYDPEDPATWREARVHLPSERHVGVDEFAPRVHAAMVQLLGGAERFHRQRWSDAFIGNYGIGADRPWEPPSAESEGWHKDGDFFVHFLDSPEQGLLVIVCWTDVLERGGPTSLAPESVGVVARDLATHPEGLWPNQCLRGPEAEAARAAGETLVPLASRAWIRQCSDFHDAVGRAGDVFLMHPFMLHRASANVRRAHRLITNPPVTMRAPFCYDRPDGAHSVVEQCVLDALGVERFPFAPQAERRRLEPPRVRQQRERQAQIAARGG